MPSCHSFLAVLHWLKITKRIEYKLPSLTKYLQLPNLHICITWSLSNLVAALALLSVVTHSSTIPLPIPVTSSSSINSPLSYYLYYDNGESSTRFRKLLQAFLFVWRPLRQWCWTGAFKWTWRYLVPRTTTTLGMRSFAVAGPVIWNSLPAALRTATLFPLTFARHLKAHLFGWSAARLRTIYDRALEIPSSSSSSSSFTACLKPVFHKLIPAR